MSRRSSLARSHDNEGYRRRRASRSKRVVASDHHGTRTEVALACREAPTLTPIEAEINRRLQAMEQRLKLIESKVPTHDNFEAAKQAAAQKNPKLFLGGAMGMIKEEQSDADNSLRPRMAVADHGEVAAPDENDTNVKFAEKQVTTIAENDNSAGKNNLGDISGDPNVLVGRQNELSTAERSQGGEQAEGKAEAAASEKVAAAPAQKAEVKTGEKVEPAAKTQAAAIKKAAEQAAEKKAAADETIEVARARKAEIRAGKEAAAAEKTADKVEQAAKKQAAAIAKAD